MQHNSLAARNSDLGVGSQHCYVTGGSAGLGLALAIHLVKKGADVSIVARNEGRLKKALDELEVRPRVTPTPPTVLDALTLSAHPGRPPNAEPDYQILRILYE